MTYCKYSDQELILAVQQSSSIRQVLTKLNIKAVGGNYFTINKKIKKLNIDISHFKGYAWNKGNTFGPKRPISDYLSNKKFIHSFKLKNRLLKDKILPYECNCCKNQQWIDKPIPLELHHKDGNKMNNNLSNIELLCPNCHALTDNYRGKKNSGVSGI